MANQNEQHAIRMELDRWATVLTPSLGAGSCGDGGAACGLCIASQFTADCARRSPQDLGHATNAVLLLDQAGQGHAVRAGVADSAWLRGFASADLIRWQVLHFRYESARLPLKKSN